MAYCNHDLSGAYRHLLYRSMQHGLAYSSMILLNKKKKKKKKNQDKIIIIISSFSLFPFLFLFFFPFPSSFPFLPSPFPSFPFFFLPFLLSFLPFFTFPFFSLAIFSFNPLLSKSYNTPLYSSDMRASSTSLRSLQTSRAHSDVFEWGSSPSEKLNTLSYL